MRERLEDLLMLTLALGLLAAICLLWPSHKTAYVQNLEGEVSLPAIATVSGKGIAIVDGKVLVDINAADAEMFMSLPGIGEVLAGRIVEYREERGPFASVDDLTNVQGIGTATLERIRDELTALP